MNEIRSGLDIIKKGEEGKFLISGKIKETIRKMIHYIYIDKKYRVS